MARVRVMADFIGPPESTPGTMAAWTLVVAIFGDKTAEAAEAMERAADVAHWRANLPSHVVSIRGRAGDEKARRDAAQIEVWWRLCAAKQREHLGGL